MQKGISINYLLLMFVVYFPAPFPDESEFWDRSSQPGHLLSGPLVRDSH